MTPPKPLPKIDPVKILKTKLAEYAKARIGAQQQFERAQQFFNQAQAEMLVANGRYDACLENLKAIDPSALAEKEPNAPESSAP
jgi:hypothetical protein